MRVILSIILLSGIMLYLTSSVAGLQTSSLTITSLENSVYKLEKEEVKLRDGKFIKTPGIDGFPYAYWVEFETAALGDLNKDGLSDAAVVLSWNGGGSGIFYYLSAVVNDKGKPVNVDTLLLGDRVRIKTIRISSGIIEIKLLTHGPFDPMCCPKKKVLYRYRLIKTIQGYKLVRK
ncbi:MAG: hypothetical protein GXO97_10050 [Nitrospirae bacterium]|nr:hypothetical protein [Nitrospirota bacterium]